jgi:hypothetical protein
VSDNRVGRASMVSEMDLELEMRCGRFCNWSYQSVR